jgi:chemotaxis protein MotB
VSEDEEVVAFDAAEEGGGGLPVEEGAPLWMATFGDMMSLLLCFFILMFSMSELKMDRFLLAAQSINQAIGSTSPEPVEKPMGLMTSEADPDLQLENPGLSPGATKSPVAAEGQDETMIERVSKAYLEMIAERLRAFVEEEGLQREIEVERNEDGVYLRMRAAALFPPGEAAARGEGVGIIERLAGVTKSLNVPVIISGHADDQPISTPSFPSNWELSAARAAGVARIMIGRGQPPLLTRVESYGEFAPVADNATPEGRAQNRRVELYYSLEGIRAAMDAWAEGGDPVVAEEAGTEANVDAPDRSAPPPAAR